MSPSSYVCLPLKGDKRKTIVSKSFSSFYEIYYNVGFILLQKRGYHWIIKDLNLRRFMKVHQVHESSVITCGRLRTDFPHFFFIHFVLLQTHII